MASWDFDEPVVSGSVQHRFLPAVMLKQRPSDHGRSQIVIMTHEINKSVRRDTRKMFADAQVRKPEFLPNEPGWRGAVMFELRR